MTYKWIGAILVITGCGGFGFSMASGYRRQEMMLKQLIRVLQLMENELQYRLSPLPELCRQAGKEAGGILGDVFLNLARELDWQAAPDVCSCMSEAIRKSCDLPVNLRKHLVRLGHTLGRFDLPGQLQELQAVRSDCEKELELFHKNRNVRLRSYQTLGLCAGAALAILLA